MNIQPLPASGAHVFETTRWGVTVRQTVTMGPSGATRVVTTIIYPGGITTRVWPAG